jgi:MFS family permease
MAQNALSYAAIFGLREDTALHGQDYSWLGSIFYFGYLAMEIPSVWLMTKVPIGKYIGVCLVLWGITLCLMSVCHNFAGLATVRFFLGVFEAAVLPCMMLLNPMWYRKEEQPLRTAFWYNTFAGVFGGILSYAIGGIDGSLATWKVRSTGNPYFVSRTSDILIVYLSDLWCNDRVMRRGGLLWLARLAHKSMVPLSRRETFGGGQARG